MSQTASYAWYRLRATFGSELSAFVTIVVLVGALGGLSMGAVAAARSTESSFSDFVASTHVPQLFVFDGVINPSIGLDSAYNPALLRQLARLPHVERVESTVELNMGPATPNGHPITAASGTPAEATGIALGRVLWNLFANQISAVPVPTVPAGTIVVIGIVAVVLAVLVATIPGRLAARTPTSRLLRVE